MCDPQAREILLSSRGKLKSNPNTTQIWINEELPDAYRRRKTMLGELVKHIKLQGDHTVSIERGGLKLDGPDQLYDLPKGCHPSDAQIIETANNGLAFASEGAFLSNVHPCNFLFEDMQFTNGCTQDHFDL